MQKREPKSVTQYGLVPAHTRKHICMLSVLNSDPIVKGENTVKDYPPFSMNEKLLNKVMTKGHVVERFVCKSYL